MDAGFATRANRSVSNATWNRCVTRRTRRFESLVSISLGGTSLNYTSLNRDWILHRPKAVGNHWQVVEPNASGVKNGVTDGRSPGLESSHRPLGCADHRG